MNPIIQKARDLLSGRAEQEAKDQEWREAHADAVASAEVDILLAKTATPQTIKQRDYGELVYKQNDAALVQSEPEEEISWQAWVKDYIEDVIEIIGSETFDMIREEIAKANRTRVVLFDPSEAMAKEIQKQTATLAEKRQLDELHHKAKTLHNVVFDRLRALERQFDRYVETSNKEFRSLRQQLDTQKKRRQA